MRQDEYPGIFISADDAAIRTRRTHFWLLRIEIILLLATATVSVVWERLRDNPLAAATFLVGLLVLVFGVGGLRQIRKYDHAWFLLRATAESAKFEAWRFMMTVEPYSSGGEYQAESRLLDRLQQLLVDLRPEVTRYLSSANESPAITDVMRRTRELTLGDRRDTYNAQRLRDQRLWYSRRARRHAVREAYWFYSSWGLRVGAVLVALFTVFLGNFPVGIVGAVTTGAAAAQSWNNAQRHRELSQSYSVIAQELQILQERGGHVRTEDDLANWVLDTERTISREHTRWVVRRVI